MILLLNFSKLVVLQKNAPCNQVYRPTAIKQFLYSKMSFTQQKVIGQSWKRQQFNRHKLFLQNLGMIENELDFFQCHPDQLQN
jgi:hypothetical protein